MITKFKIHEVKWYKGGKLEPDDSFHIEEENIFKIGDLVHTIKGKEIFYWNDAGDEGNIHNIGKRGGWMNIKYYIDGRITDVNQCTNADGYTGQLIKLPGHWPWFQTTNIVKKNSNEGVKWFKDGKLEPDNSFKDEPEFDDPVASLKEGDYILIDHIDFWSGEGWVKYVGSDRDQYHQINQIISASKLRNMGEPIKYDGLIFSIKGKYGWYKFEVGVRPKIKNDYPEAMGMGQW